MVKANYETAVKPLELQLHVVLVPTDLSASIPCGCIVRKEYMYI